MILKPLLLSLLTALGALSLCTTHAQGAQFTPLAWQQEVMQHYLPGLVGQRKHLYWVRDRNLNFIDDEIERRFRRGSKVDVIVDLNRCLKPEEIQALVSEYGSIGYVGKLITYVMVDQVRFEQLQRLAVHPFVAMVEWQEPAQIMNDVSTRAVQARASTTYPRNSAQDSGITGAGINVAIVDTGVDDAHETLAGKFVAGFDALNFSDTNSNGIDDSCEPPPLGNGICTDPDDESGNGATNPLDYEGHGTHVAGTAIGTGARGSACYTFGDFAPTTCAGVAPGAGLIDINVCNARGRCPAQDQAEALDWLAINATRFNIRVANLSFGSCESDPGTSALAQQVNYLVSLGVNVVVAHGNSGLCGVPPGAVLVGSPGSASFAITVSGTNHRNTVRRTDDTNFREFMRGPRSDFAVSENLLALKPDISAPAENIVSAQRGTTSDYASRTGSSQAAPHVTGAVALVLEARARMNPAFDSGIDPGSVKDLLLRSADATHNRPAFPGNPWDSALGWGMLNVWPAISNVAATDVKFPNCVGPGMAAGQPCALPAPLPFWNNELDISTSMPPQAGVPNTITTQVRNDGPVPATVLIDFGVYIFAVGNNQFFHIGTQRRTIPRMSTITVSQEWTPSSSDHQCIQVSIDYGHDTNPGNNVSQRNLQIAASVYEVRVENPFMVSAEFRVEAKSDRDGWVCRVNHERFRLDPFRDCPMQLGVTFDAPAGTPPGESANCNVAIFGTPDGEKPRPIGGVTVRTFVPKPCVVEGVVVDPNGKPTRGARLEFERVPEPRRPDAMRRSDRVPMPAYPKTPPSQKLENGSAQHPLIVTSDANGKFLVTLPGGIEYRVRVKKSRLGTGQLSLLLVCGRQLKFVFSKNRLTVAANNRLNHRFPLDSSQGIVLSRSTMPTRLRRASLKTSALARKF